MKFQLDLFCLVHRRLSLVFTVFRLMTDFVCLYNYEFWLSLCKIVRSSVILLLPLLDHLLVLAIFMTLLKICHFPLSNLPHSLVLLKDSLGRKSLPYFMSGMSCIFSILLYPFNAPVLSSTWSRYLLSKTCSLYHVGQNLTVNAHFISSTLSSCSTIIVYFTFLLVLFV